MASSLRAAVAGCTGYIGIQSVRLVQRHPRLRLAAVVGRSHAGKVHAQTVPGSDCDLVIGDDLDGVDADVIFAALPHAVAAGHAREWLSRSMVVDMSADFRLRDARLYETWYGGAHPAPELLGEAVYGLVELERSRLQGANLIAAPGCYPTAALLATVPALRAGVVEPQVVVDAKSGVSGAGRSPSMTVHFSEVNEAVRAYGVGGHRHSAEMQQQLDAAAGSAVQLTFVPHLVPMTRGILATAYLRPSAGHTPEDAVAAVRELAASNPFVRWEEAPPSTKSVTGSNVAAVNATVQGDVTVVTCAIDNLVKGAAGQGVQAFNVRMGWDETDGLEEPAAWP